jgi:hypothetical protein
MEITINRSKTQEFFIDGNGELHTPQDFKENRLSDLSGLIFIIIADYCIRTSQNKISGDEFHALLSCRKMEFDKDTVSALTSLEQHDYLKIENL